MSRRSIFKPRLLNTGLEPSHYKAGMRAELQKFGSINKDKQLSLWLEEEASKDIVVSGLDLSVSEAKSLSAVQILLNKTKYKGTEETALKTFEDYGGWRGRTPKISMSFSQYFEAYGLERKGDGNYYGHQADEALEALRSLADKRRAIQFERKHKKGAKELTDIIKVITTLLKLTEITGYKDLEQEEAETVRSGGDVPAKARASGLVVELSPLLVQDIGSFYTIKPAALHREIQQLIGNKRASRTLSLFIEWLLTKDQATIKASMNTLIERMRLTSYIKIRHRERAEMRLQEAFTVAKELKYLLDYSTDPATGIMTFSLNSERCRRIPKATDPTPAKEGQA